MSVPVSVIIPHMASRKDFLMRQVLPSVEACEPEEILVISDPALNAQEKRNEGARRARKPFLFFCDDDVTLANKSLSKFCEAIRIDSRYGFCFSDYERIVHPGVKYPYQSGKIRPEGNIIKRLKYESPLCTMCLIRKEAFPGFDERLRRHQDRDLFLTIIGKGWSFTYVPGFQVTLHQIDDISITQMESYELWERYIELKHGLPKRLPEYRCEQEEEWGKEFVRNP